METTNQNNLDKIISQDTEKINNDEQTKSEIVYAENTAIKQKYLLKSVK